MGPHLELLGDFFHRPVFLEVETRRFGKWICFRPQVKMGEKTPTQLGLLERANLNHRTRGKVQNPSNCVCYIPSSEPIKIYLWVFIAMKFCNTAMGTQFVCSPK
jgi:hypothetical protein